MLFRMTKPTTPTLRYWLSKELYRDRIRVEWTGPHGRITSEGVLRERSRYKDVFWLYDAPPDDLSTLALECLIADGEYEPDDAELMGYETHAQMEAAVEASGYQEAA